MLMGGIKALGKTDNEKTEASGILLQGEKLRQVRKMDHGKHV